MHGYKQMTGQLASYIAVAIGPIRQKILIAYLIRHFLKNVSTLLATT